MQINAQPSNKPILNKIFEYPPIKDISLALSNTCEKIKNFIIDIFDNIINFLKFVNSKKNCDILLQDREIDIFEKYEKTELINENPAKASLAFLKTAKLTTECSKIKLSGEIFNKETSVNLSDFIKYVDKIPKKQEKTSNLKTNTAKEKTEIIDKCISLEEQFDKIPNEIKTNFEKQNPKIDMDMIFSDLLLKLYFPSKG